MKKSILLVLAWVGFMFIFCSLFGLGFADLDKAINEVFVFATSGLGIVIIIIVVFFYLLNRKKNEDEDEDEKEEEKPKKKRAPRKNKDELIVKETRTTKITKK